VTTAGSATRATAGIYTRISLAAMGDTTKTDDQERICRDLAERLGWNVADVYCDASKSAWRKDRKRPAWDRMLGDVESGRVRAIVVYHGDRLVRQPWDLETLLNLADAKGVNLASPTGTRNLDDPNDRFVLRILTAQACMESDNTSRRRKAQYDRYRREGRVRPGGPGGRSFGFEGDNLTVRPAEFELVREAARRILAAESPYSVCRDWNARGLTATTGKPWRTGNLVPMLQLARYAGLMPDGESPAAWPAALDRETWERVRLVLSGRAAAFPGHTNARRWLLSGIALCGACSSPVTARWMRRNIARGLEAAAVYGCVAEGCRAVSRSAPHLDAYVAGRVIARLANPLSPAGRPPAADHAAEWAILQRERDDTDAQVADYKASAGRVRSLMARLDSIDARMAELRDRDAGDSRARLLERYAGWTREQWEDDDLTPLSVRRALVSACFRVVVLAASGRGPGFRVQDVDMRPLA
jgi:site-specific DNA recombinase